MSGMLQKYVDLDIITGYEPEHEVFTVLKEHMKLFPEETRSIVPILANIMRSVLPCPRYRYSIELFEEGYTVLPVLSSEQIHEWRQSLHACIHSFPEYKNTAVPVLGGFAALGNPASFHHPDIRRMRTHVYKSVRKRLLRPYSVITGEEESLRSELLFDRVMYRQAGQLPSPEAWHRDVCVPPPKSSLAEGDSIIGGWTNLDDTDQYFSCVPATHNDGSLVSFAPGFSTIGKEEHEQLRRRSRRVRVPPGHTLCFFQHLVHEVVAGKAQTSTMYRMFHGFRLTHGDRPLFDSDYLQRSVFDDQAIPRLPSFQFPPMYSSNHGSCLLGLPREMGVTTLRDTMRLPGQATKTNPIKWSLATFHEPWLVDRVHGKTGMKYRLVHRFMPSLKEGGVPLYPAYKEDERELYTPLSLNK